MSTEEKKWTQEELEEFLQEQEQEWDDEWEDEWGASLPGEEDKWAEMDEAALRQKEEEWRKARKRAQDVEEYRREGFWLGEDGKLLEELIAWLPRKDEEEEEEEEEEQEDRYRKDERMMEWRELKRLDEYIKRVREWMAPLERKIRGSWFAHGDDYDELKSYEERLLELLGYRSAQCDWLYRQKRYAKEIWLVGEWRNYLRTKELMLRMTRSNDVTGMIMNFC